MIINLSPYEKNRMIPQALGQTDMGRDLLEQDYILKQITASMVYPEKQLGKKFWDRVYAKARTIYGTTEIPVNTFNKVWIVADEAKVFEHHQTAFVVSQHLKVMLEEDYLASQKHNVETPFMASHNKDAINRVSTSTVTSNIIRQIILPELEKEVNTGKNFANLRQIVNSLILANWYKNNLKEALLNKFYTNQGQVKGIDLKDPSVKEKIYEQYLKAYKKGVFNYIKEEVTSQGVDVPRKYFSGGFNEAQAVIRPQVTTDPAELARVLHQGDGYSGKGFVDFATVTSTGPGTSDKAEIVTNFKYPAFSPRKLIDTQLASYLKDAGPKYFGDERLLRFVKQIEGTTETDRKIRLEFIGESDKKYVDLSENEFLFFLRAVAVDDMNDAKNFIKSEFNNQRAADIFEMQQIILQGIDSIDLSNPLITAYALEQASEFGCFDTQQIAQMANKLMVLWKSAHASNKDKEASVIAAAVVWNKYKEQAGFNVGLAQEILEEAVLAQNMVLNELALASRRTKPHNEIPFGVKKGNLDEIEQHVLANGTKLPSYQLAAIIDQWPNSSLKKWSEKVFKDVLLDVSKKSTRLPAEALYIVRRLLNASHYVRGQFFPGYLSSSNRKNLQNYVTSQLGAHDLTAAKILATGIRLEQLNAASSAMTVTLDQIRANPKIIPKGAYVELTYQDRQVLGGKAHTVLGNVTRLPSFHLRHMNVRVGSKIISVSTVDNKKKRPLFVEARIIKLKYKQEWQNRVGNAVNACTFTSDGKEVVIIGTADGRMIMLAHTGEELFEQSYSRYPISDIAVRGNKVAFGDEIGTIRVVDIESGQLIEKFFQRGKIEAINFISDEQLEFFLNQGKEKNLRVEFDLKNNSLMQKRLKLPEGNSVLSSRGERRLVINGSKVSLLDRHNFSVWTKNYGPQQKAALGDKGILLLDEKGDLKLLDPKDGAVIWEDKYNKNQLLSFAINAKNDIVLGFKDGRLRKLTPNAAMRVPQHALELYEISIAGLKAEIPKIEPDHPDLKDAKQELYNETIILGLLRLLKNNQLDEVTGRKIIRFMPSLFQLVGSLYANRGDPDLSEQLTEVEDGILYYLAPEEMEIAYRAGNSAMTTDFDKDPLGVLIAECDRRARNFMDRHSHDYPKEYLNEISDILQSIQAGVEIDEPRGEKLSSELQRDRILKFFETLDELEQAIKNKREKREFRARMIHRSLMLPAIVVIFYLYYRLNHPGYVYKPLPEINASANSKAMLGLSGEKMVRPIVLPVAASIFILGYSAWVAFEHVRDSYLRQPVNILKFFPNGNFDYQPPVPAKPKATGGIDLRASNSSMQTIIKDGQGVEMDIDPALMVRIRREGIKWLSPIILHVTRINNVWSLIMR